jgi:quercetin dioxygenase-like cupin family protein
MLAMLFFASSGIFAQGHSDSAMQHHSGHIMVNGAGIKWMDGPPFLPAGVKLAVLEGDPSKEGPYTVRLLMPANYSIPPHTHPTIEHVTVIEGSLFMGAGNTLNRTTATQLKSGGYAVMPAGFAHYVFSKGRTIVQVHGTGPFAINYINPVDDPRNKK